MRNFLTIILGLAVVLAMEPAYAKRKRPAQSSPPATLAAIEPSGWPARVVGDCIGGTWLNVGVDDDNPGGCQYFCVTTEGAGMTVETLAPCPE